MKKMIALTCALAAFATTATLPTIEGESATGFTAVTNLADGVKTMIAVPYQACVGGEIAVKDLVSTQGLAAVSTPDNADNAARLFVLQGTSSVPVYNVYYLDSAKGWSTTNNPSEPMAASVTVGSGNAVFLVDPTADTAYIKGGLVTNDQNTVCSNGYNLVSAISTEVYNLGSLTFTTPTGAGKAKNADQIILQDGKVIWYKTGEGWRYQGAAVTLSDVVIPAGAGFWYYNASETPVVITPNNNN
ncbi:MAG: hypothetical protein J5985_07375 [Kiritimatiellae bacterium]|nr:hypothetical protein [Kiritimatiellia bacterium]